MAKKLISYDDTAPRTGLPEVVETRLDGLYLAEDATPTSRGLMSADDKAKLDALTPTDLPQEPVEVFTAADFTPQSEGATYSTITIPLDTDRKVYVRGSTQDPNQGQEVPLITGHRADATSALITQSGLENYGNVGVSTIAAVFDIAAEFTSITVRLYNSTHPRYRQDFAPLIVVGATDAGIAAFLRGHDGIGKRTEFPHKGHAWSNTATYDSGTVFTYPGMEVEYAVAAAGSSGARMEWGKPKVQLTANQDTVEFDSFGVLALSTYGPTHGNYSSSFDAYYTILGDEVEVEDNAGIAAAAAITGSYLPTPTLKAIRQVQFSDGTPQLAIQYLWHDRLGKFYISSSLHGDKKWIFDYKATDFHGEPVERWSMNFDRFGNIVCVFRTEQLSWAVADDNLRKNPILIVKDQGYKPTVIDFGSSLKPSAWLQDNGFIYTDEYIMLTEYTRPNMETANTWKATYPLTAPANWQVVQSWDVIEPFKHIHNVDRDPYTGHVYTSTGDVDAAAGIYASTDGGDTFTTVIDGSEKHCRVLNFVFMKDWIYWATDSSGANHWLFRAPRDANGVMDADNIEELIQFPSDSHPTYFTIHLPKIDALLFLNRSDGFTDTLPVDLWDLRAGRMIRLDSIPAVGGIASTIGFRCECAEYVPRGNEVAVGFSNTTGEGGYQSRLGLLGNTTSASAKVQNLIMTVERIPGATEDSFTIGYDTSVI